MPGMLPGSGNRSRPSLSGCVLPAWALPSRSRKCRHVFRHLINRSAGTIRISHLIVGNDGLRHRQIQVREIGIVMQPRTWLGSIRKICRWILIPGKQRIKIGCATGPRFCDQMKDRVGWRCCWQQQRQHHWQMALGTCQPVSEGRVAHFTGCRIDIRRLDRSSWPQSLSLHLRYSPSSARLRNATKTQRVAGCAHFLVDLKPALQLLAIKFAQRSVTGKGHVLRIFR